MRKTLKKRNPIASGRAYAPAQGKPSKKSIQSGVQWTTNEAIEIGRQALIVFLKVAMPLMLISLSVGLIISLFQALTQIQEMTLTFVPKLVVMFASLIFLMPFMSHTLGDFNDELNRRIIAVGHSNE